MKRKVEKHRFEERRERKVEDYGADMVKGLGTVNMGVSRFSKEPYTEATPSLESKWSKLHDTSMKEAMRMAGGKSEE